MTTDSRAPRRDARQNREGILAAAAAAISHDPRATVDTIARRAGLTRRALYGHFADRDALVAEMLARGAARFNAIAETVDDPDATLALARLTSKLWQEAAHVQVAASLALDDAHVADTALALAPLRRRILEIVRLGQAGGGLRTDIPPLTLARLIEETGRVTITRVDAASATARSLAVRAVLSIAGLAWREAAALLAQHPELGDEE